MSIYRTLCFYLVALTTFLLDQLGKLAIVTAIAFGHSRPLIDGFFHLTHVHNEGGAWSLLNGHVGLLAAFSIVVSLGIIAYHHVARPEAVPAVLGLGLLLGGAAGNMADRLWLGHVRDFFELRWYGQNIFPIWNIADMAVLAGVALILLHQWQHDRAMTTA